MAPTATATAVTLLLVLSLALGQIAEYRQLPQLPAAATAATAAVHRCQSDPQTIATNEPFLLLLKHPFYHYLKPNLRCEIRVQLQPPPAADSRQRPRARVKWMISVVNASLQAYSASAVFTEDNGLTVLANLTDDTDQLDNYQFASSSSSSSNFSVDFVTTDLPELFSTGLELMVEPVVRCPQGWLDTGIGCYGLLGRSASGQLVTQPQARAACARIGGSLSNGVYNNDHIDQTLASLLMTSPAGGATYWVGIVAEAGKNYSYSNGFSNPHRIEQTGDCSSRASGIDCNCVVYQSGRFLSQPCSSSHRFVCAMPHPGFEPHCLHQKCDTDQADRRRENCDCSGWKVALAFMGGLAFVALLVVACFCGCVLRRRGGGI